MKRYLSALALTASALVPMLCFAQTATTKPLRIVVGFAPGGAPDILARILAKKLTENTGQAVIVENRAGASGNIAAQAVAKGEPDGHTLLMATVSVAIAPSMQPGLGFAPSDFEPVGMVASVPLVLISKPALGINNLADLLALAKKNPGKLNYASVGNGSPQHLSGELFQLMGAVKLAHIPYKGGGPATQSVLEGETDLFFAGGDAADSCGQGQGTGRHVHQAFIGRTGDSDGQRSRSGRLRSRQLACPVRRPRYAARCHRPAQYRTQSRLEQCRRQAADAGARR